MARRGPEAIQATMKRTQQLIDPPPIALNERAMELYCEVMGSIPSDARSSAVHRAMAANIALALAEVETCTALLDAEGPVIASPQGVKAHPAASVRDAASKRVAALAAKLRALPAIDSREAQRVLRQEQEHRTAAPVLRGEQVDSNEVDWIARLKAEEA